MIFSLSVPVISRIFTCSRLNNSILDTVALSIVTHSSLLGAFEPSISPMTVFIVSDLILISNDG